MGHGTVDETLTVCLVLAQLQILLQLQQFAANGIHCGVAGLAVANGGTVGSLLALVGRFAQLLQILVGLIVVRIVAGQLAGRQTALLPKRTAHLGHNHAQQTLLVGHARPCRGLQSYQAISPYQIHTDISLLTPSTVTVSNRTRVISCILWFDFLYCLISHGEGFYRRRSRSLRNISAVRDKIVEGNKVIFPQIGFLQFRDTTLGSGSPRYRTFNVLMSSINCHKALISNRVPHPHCSLIAPIQRCRLVCKTYRSRA